MNNEQSNEVVYLYLDDIIPNRFQPREVFDEKALKELAVSIREHGVIQPIIVRNVGGKYEIIAGERRYKATALAGLTKIPAIIRNLDDKESSKVALLENLQRKNLSPIEEARTYQKILEIDQMTQEELAKTMGKSQSSVANKLRLLSLPDEIQDALLKEQISERHARTLLNIPDVKKQKEMLRKIINNKMTVRSVEDEIKQMYPRENDLPNDNDYLNNNFVNNNSLMPTVDLSAPTNNYGKVTVAPPNEENNNKSNILNYGEINDSSDEDNGNQYNLNQEFGNTNIDIQQMRQRANDINKSNNQNGGLDSLLNLGDNSQGPSISGGEFKYITPAEGIINDSTQQNGKQEEDYFKATEDENFSDIFPESSLNGTNNNISGSEKYSIDEATNKIRDLIEDLKKHGIEASADEMNFEKTYQIIIKIEK